jgi:4-hydroxybenzoate polyprenyltransferase
MAEAAQAAGIAGGARLLWRSARPRHWIKNLFVLAPLFFSGQVRDPARVVAALLAFASFCAMASAAYCANDVVDRERDRQHPRKRHRPVASGALSPAAAVAGAVLLALLAVVLAAAVSRGLLATLVGYAALNAVYSHRLKHLVVLDVFCVAAGFVLRVVGGGTAVGVVPTSWLVSATFLLALFLSLAKRRNELVLLARGSGEHRPVLESYTVELVDEYLRVVTPVTLVTYLLYTLEESTVARFGTRHLYATGLFVAFGLFRYLYLVHRKGQGGDPVEIALRDMPIVATIIAWVGAFAAIVYLA